MTCNGWCSNFSGRQQISGLVVRGLEFDFLLSNFRDLKLGLSGCHAVLKEVLKES